MTKKGINEYVASSAEGRLKSKLTSTVAVATIASVATIGLSMLGGGVANAWGPTRQTFTMQNPPDFVTFNSITDNPDVGDERNFLRVRDADEQYWQQGTTNGWTDTISNMQAGHTYDVRMYVHNNGIEGLYLAQNVRAHVNLPTSANSWGKQYEVNGYLYSSNATPKEIWDNIVLKSDQDFHVKVVSAKYYNNLNTEKQGGFDLTDDIYTAKGEGTGALLGYNEMNGYINSCLPFSGYVLMKIQPVFATEPVEPVTSYDVEKTVDKTTAKPGDTLNYRITVRNTGNVELTNLQITDVLPDDAYISEKNVLMPSEATDWDDSLLDDGTITINNLLPGGEVTINVALTLKDATAFPCGEATLTNTVISTTDQDDTEDNDDNNTVNTIVQNDCPVPTVPPETEQPGAPNAGVGTKTAVVSLIAFLGCAIILSKVLLKKRHGQRR